MFTFHMCFLVISGVFTHTAHRKHMELIVLLSNMAFRFNKSLRLFQVGKNLILEKNTQLKNSYNIFWHFNCILLYV